MSSTRNRRFALPTAALIAVIASPALADFNDDFTTTGILADNYGFFGLATLPDSETDPTSFSDEFGAADDYVFGDAYTSGSNTYGNSSFDLDESLGQVDMTVSGGQGGHFQFVRLSRSADESNFFDLSQGVQLKIMFGGLDGQSWISTPRNPIVFGFASTDNNPEFQIQIGNFAGNDSLLRAQADGVDLPGLTYPVSSILEASYPPVNVAFFGTEAILNIDADSYSLIINPTHDANQGWTEMIPDTPHGLTFAPGEGSIPFFEARRVYGGANTTLSVTNFSVTGTTVVVDPGLPGDFNEDGVLDSLDIDLLFANLGATTPSDYDLNEDGTVDNADVDLLVEGADYLNSFYGDANTDQAVDLLDLSALASNFEEVGKLWADGDFNGDGYVNLLDLSILATNFDQSKAVPEPASVAVLGLMAAALRRRG
ncbi:dockerin type I domain-containing protein [Mucisphaera calidilacus]|uniref:Dockerin domain-containing protein n=1 Tax=Mucisphaera calidilacus TaxID=2527982 RepID=A0A518BUH3_9BACT|nr:dockerin type I domain-containing protein [Mucisphaera calidilacus]QDU70628.1 hypothetical protein Pan265_04560 [Mucisphaera calidilacus]